MSSSTDKIITNK